MHIYIHIYIFCIWLGYFSRVSFYFDKKLKSKIALLLYGIINLLYILLIIIIHYNILSVQNFMFNNRAMNCFFSYIIFNYFNLKK